MALASCLINAVGGDFTLVATPANPFYQYTDVKPYNQNYPLTPAAITYPRSAEQIAAIVECAVSDNRKVQARSGGHSYANYCM